jgi:uncharacterized glyoxalase superfamily protein PhnB
MSEPPPTTLHVYLGYRDAPAAIDWLERVLGFGTTMRYPEEGDEVMHAELRLGPVDGGAALVVYTDREAQRPPRHGETNGQGIYLAVADEAGVDAVHARAVEAGAPVVWKPETSEWGNHRCRFLDPEGFEWTFGTHRPGQPAWTGGDH